MSKQDSSK